MPRRIVVKKGTLYIKGTNIAIECPQRARDRQGDEMGPCRATCALLNCYYERYSSPGSGTRHRVNVLCKNESMGTIKLTDIPPYLNTNNEVERHLCELRGEEYLDDTAEDELPPADTDDDDDEDWDEGVLPEAPPIYQLDPSIFNEEPATPQQGQNA